MELERVYALYGTSDSGKTSCLNQLIEILIEKSEQAVLIENVGDVDRRAVFLINGKYVGVSTQGDTKSQIKTHLDEIECQCNIIFCATRTRGSTCVHVIERFGEKLTWIENMGIYNHKAHAFDNSAFISAKNVSLADLMFTLIR